MATKAKLTPAAKIIITVAVLAVFGAATWHLGVKDMLSDDVADGTDRSDSDEKGTSSGDAIGTDDQPLKVSIVSFHGYAPALVANGSSLTTEPGSIFANEGLSVEFVIQDDIPTLATIFESGAAHCAWRTSDFWAQEQPNLRNNKLDARAVMVVDNTQGADAIITRDPSIRKVEDLVGKKVALLQYTPSHGMIIDAVENSSLTARQRTKIDYVFINADEGTAGVRAAFEGGQVDAAVLWDPDLSLALEKVSGSRVIYSTRTATNLVYDVIVCDKRVLDKSSQRDAVQKLVNGWMAGVEKAEADHDGAVKALVDTEEFFKLLEKEQGASFIKDLFKNLRWTGLEENARILGMAGGTNHYERVYKRFDVIYRAAGALANPNSPVVNPSDSFDYRFIKDALGKAPGQVEEAKKPEFTFDETSATAAQKKADTLLTKPVTVNFASGSAELSKRSQKTIDEDMVPLIESNGAAYFEVSGNTDSTGSKATNMRLSTERADSVVEYLASQWEFPKERFVVVGNGPNKPLCNEKTPDEGLDLDGCRARNRATRVAVLRRNEAE